MTPLIELAERVERYDPKLSPDNRADELELHQAIVMATGIGSLTCDFDRTFVRSLDAAMQLYIKVPERIPSDPRKATAEALRQRAEDV